MTPAEQKFRSGFTLAEIMVVVALVSLLLLIPVLNLVEEVRDKTFEMKVQKLLKAFQMASSAAAQSERRFEVILDIPEQSYLMREIKNPDLTEVLEEEIIVKGDLGENCWISFVEFDDGDFTNDSRAKFRAGHGGWQYGGKVVLIDKNEQPWSIVVNRISPIVSLVKGDAGLLTPRTAEEVMF